MEKVLHFLSYYNTQIIQSGFAIVFLLIIIYVYRAFFMASTGAEDAETTSTSGLEQKLNQILEQQRIKPGATADVSSGNAVTKSIITEQEVDKLKSEIYNLRQQLNDAESSASLANSSVKKSQSLESTTTDEVEVSYDLQEAKVNEAMTVKVKELESRLAEYEIIADDIAELSQLRADNTKLKEQLSQLQSSNVQSSEIPSAPENVPEPVAAAASNDLSGQAMVDALFAEANAGVQPAESVVLDNDQNLLNEFEKITQKKGNE